MFRQSLLRSSWSRLYLVLRVPGAEKRYLVFTCVELNRVEEPHRFGWVWLAPKIRWDFEGEIAFGEKSLWKCFVSYSCS